MPWGPAPADQVRRRSFRRYALVAGFNEIGESIEETVRREVLEETGLQVDNLRFYKSQPWVVTDSLLFGFLLNWPVPIAFTSRRKNWPRPSGSPDALPPTTPPTA